MSEEEASESHPQGESMLQKVLLLVLTAVLTGFLIPYVNGRIQEQQAHHAELEAAEIARQGSVIEAQQELLAELESTLFEYYSHSAAMPWYRVRQPDPERFAKALDAWDASGWSLMVKQDVLLSRSRRLVSPAVFERLRKHRERWDEIDLRMIRLVTKEQNREPVPAEEWEKIMDDADAQWEQTGELLHAVAQDLQLVPEKP